MRMVKIFVFILFILLSIAFILKYEKNIPYFYIGLELFLVLILMAIRSGRPRVKALFFNLAIVILVFSLAEAHAAGWFLGKNNRFAKREGSHFSRQYYRDDDIRGHAAAKNISVTGKLTKGNKVVYDVLYSTNRYGLRVSPHDLRLAGDKTRSDFKNAVFFGCSFTVGEGLNDNETLPYLFEERSRGRYRSYNFGFHGYGPHQMLRIIETGLLDEVIADKKPALAVYLALIEHVERVCGNYPQVFFGSCGPRYQLDSSGEIKYTGKIRNKFVASVMVKMCRSHLIRNTLTKLFGWKRTPEDLRLFLKVIEKSKELFTQKYNADFYVLLWTNRSDKDYDYVLSELKRKNIKVITTEEIFRKYDDPEENYLIKNDGHPNKLANERMADYLLENIR